MRPNVIYLQVPYTEKENAKALGARWDPQEKLWFIPNSIELEQFSKWLPEANNDKRRVANNN
jgi:hypothetical protein